MDKYPTVSAIVPVFNEEKYVDGVINSLLESAFLTEIIAVNDGSTDNSRRILESFGQKINLINLKRNKGKSYAVSEGIKKAKSDLIMFIDADVIGLTTKHTETMVKGYNHKVNGVLGNMVGYKSPVYQYWNVFNKLTSKVLKYDPLTGERVYAKKDLLPLLPQMKELGYGLEVFLNNKFKKIKVIQLENVYQPPKEEKNGFNYETLRCYVKEGMEVSKELAKQQGIKGKEIIKFQREYLKKFMKTYINPGKKWKLLFKRYINDLSDFIYS